MFPRLAERAGDAALAADVAALTPRVLELSEFLVDRLGVEDVGASFPHRVTYHPTCHSLRGLHLGDRPLRLLRAVRGIDLVELPDAEECCGFGGTFAVKNADVSLAMLADKLRCIDATGAEVCAAADNSCLLHIGGGLARLESRAADAAPRRDPGCDGDSTVTSFPRARPEGPGRRSSSAGNLEHATRTIREKRSRVVAELPDWEALREAGPPRRTGPAPPRRPPARARGAVAGARRGRPLGARRGRGEPDRGRTRHATGASEVVKVKSLTTEEIGLNEALEEHGIDAIETDLAALIVQLGGDTSSHILVPAIHKNRAQIRDLFERELGVEGLSDEPAALAEASRRYLRERFLRARVGISGANFAVAATGTVCVVESEGNGRMCTTLPETLITVMGIEKVVATLADLEIFLQLLPRSSTAERMNPYTSLWTGVHEGDGPREFHLVLLDNGRTNVLADAVGRETLRCIRCSACLNVCPVYSRTGGHAYGSVYPGPIGAILTPQLLGLGKAGSLPFASSLCGACADVCPVRIDIPRVLIHLRGLETAHGRPSAERASMRTLGRIFASRERYERLQRLARRGQGLPGLARLPGPLREWGKARELPEVPAESFRDWWRRERGG